MQQFFWFDDYTFEWKDIGLKGFIDKEKIGYITPTLFNEIRSVLKLILQEDPPGERELLQKQINDKDLKNFIFIRSIFDYSNIAPSDAYAQNLLYIYRRYPFLFRPRDKFWNERKISKNQREKVITILLLGIRGFFRTKFSTMIKHWINIVNFLDKECDSDASNFFLRMTEKIGINPIDENALEKIQLKLENTDIKRKVGIHFPYGKKNGRLLFTMMTKNIRGFGFLKGVKKVHLKNFNLPVDSQVIRVSLNSGLIKFTSLNLGDIKIGKKDGQGVEIARADLTEVCQKAWKLVAEKLGLYPIDLDYYIWSLGKTFCKTYGELCYLCPLTKICDSWNSGYIKESRGVDWNKGCFSFGRAGNIDRLILRTCTGCPDYKSTIMGMGCMRGEKYRVLRTSYSEIETLLKLLEKGDFNTFS